MKTSILLFCLLLICGHSWAADRNGLAAHLSGGKAVRGDASATAGIDSTNVDAATAAALAAPTQSSLSVGPSENAIAAAAPARGAADTAATATSTTTTTGTSAKAVAPQSEQDIQLHLEAAAKPAAEGSSPATKGVLALLILGALAGGAYFLLGKYKRAQFSRNTAPEIKILRQHYLAPKKSLAIIRVAGESILIGITDQNINLIKSLSLLDDEVPEELPGQDFGNALQDAQSQTYKTNGQPIANPPPSAASTRAYATNTKAGQNFAKADLETDEYSISGIKDFVNTRLKNMRSLN